MVISADFEKQKQYFDKKNIDLSHYCFIEISLYHNIACQNRSSDEGLNEILKPFETGLVAAISLAMALRYGLRLVGLTSGYKHE
jgi:hypothetical protein